MYRIAGTAMGPAADDDVAGCRWARCRRWLINADGQVIGNCEKWVPGPSNQDERMNSRAFLWHDGHMTLLGTLGGKTSTALALNDGGQIVGKSDAKISGEHAFLGQDGRMVDLGWKGSESIAVAINAKGQIVVEIGSA